MNRLTKTLIIGHDILHEELKTIFPWKKRVEKLINPIPKELEVSNIKVNETASLNSYNRTTEIITVDGINIRSELFVAVERKRAENHFYVNNIEEVYMIVERIEHGVRNELHFTKPEHKFYDTIIECTYDPSIPLTSVSPIKIKIISQGKTLEGEIILKNPYPPFLDEIKETFTIPAEPLTITFNPVIAGAIIGIGRIIPLKFFIEEFSAQTDATIWDWLLKVVESIILDLKFHHWVPTVGYLVVNALYNIFCE